MITNKMNSKALHLQTIDKEASEQGEASSAKLQSPDRILQRRLGEKHNTMARKNMEKNVLDDIMGDPDDFGDMGASDVESDGGRWEDTLKDMEQCDNRVEESLQRKLIHSQASCDVSCNPKQQKSSEASLHEKAECAPRGEQDCLKTETLTCQEEASDAPLSMSNNVATQFTAQSKRFFIIKSLNYHNIEKSIEKGIWATQAMNERILNEAFETADKVILIFSVNMSGHFQGYAQMISAIGRRKVDVWSEANWGGTFCVEWIRLYDLPFQRTLHLKNPLNSYKPVKISRDCQELTAEIGEALCALLDEGVESKENSKRRVHLRSDYITNKPYLEMLPPFESSAYFSAPVRNQMHSVVYPAQHLPTMPGRSPYMKHAGSSSSRSMMHFRAACDLNQQQEDKEAVVDASREEDFLNMSYEEYLQFRKNAREYQRQGSSSSQFGVGWGGKEDVKNCADDPYATYLASWYASQRIEMMHNGYYQTSPTITSSFQNINQPP